MFNRLRQFIQNTTEDNRGKDAGNPKASIHHRRSAPDSDVKFGPEVQMNQDSYSIRGNTHPKRDLSHSPVQADITIGRLDHSHLSTKDLSAYIPSRSEIFVELTSGMTTTLERIVEIADNKHVGTFVLLTGPTGCGKTTMAKTYCHIAGEPMTELNFSGDTTLGDFFHRTELVTDIYGNPSTFASMGPAAEAMFYGTKLLINEINMLPPDLINIITNAMDTGRLILSGTEFGNIEIEVHQEFGIIATANPNYVGTTEISRSLERRFGLGLGNVPVEFLPAEQEAASVSVELERQPLVQELGLKVDMPIINRLVTLAETLRTHREVGGQMRDRLSTRSLVHWLGLGAVTGMPLTEVGSQSILTICPSEVKEQIQRITESSLSRLKIATSAPKQLADVMLSDIGPKADNVLEIPELASPGSSFSATDGLPSEDKSFTLADGAKVSLSFVEGVAPKICMWDPSGNRVDEASELAKYRHKLRAEHGIAVPLPIGHIPSTREQMPCFGVSSWNAARIAQAAILLGYPVFLRGPTGCGKSTLARTIAGMWRLPIIEFSFTGETTKSDLTAVRKLRGGETYWSSQAFLEAVQKGLFVIINEYNMAYPDVHSIINGLFDKAGLVTLPNGEEIRAHPNFRLIATGFEDGPGVKPLNEAVENRFGAVINLDYPDKEEETAILNHISPSHVNRDTIDNIVHFVSSARAILSDSLEELPINSGTNIPPDLATAVSERAALTTAELIRMVRGSRSADELNQWFRRAITEGAPPEVQRVLGPVLINYGLS
tara:strand:+ start:3245 stop:5572 length:2328 start_codon:yes stop_codon:yes gene_type:complete